MKYTLTKISKIPAYLKRLAILRRLLQLYLQLNLLLLQGGALGDRLLPPGFNRHELVALLFLCEHFLVKQLLQLGDKRLFAA